MLVNIANAHHRSLIQLICPNLITDHAKTIRDIAVDNPSQDKSFIVVVDMIRDLCSQ